MLTEQRQLFIEEYLRLKCKNAKQAAINAGYSPRSAQTQSSRLLGDPEVAEYLQQRRAEMVRELQQAFFFDALEARQVLHDMLLGENTADRDRISVAKEFLDRAGFKAAEKMKVEGAIPVVITDDLGADDE